MIEITTTRTLAAQIHPPPIIFVLLSLLGLARSLLAGYSLAGGAPRSWIHRLAVALILSTTVSIILDGESPCLGSIRVDAADHVVLAWRESMKSPVLDGPTTIYPLWMPLFASGQPVLDLAGWLR